MKFANQPCPWITSNEKSKLNNINKTTIQTLLGCTCEKTSICSGFCTFPANNGLNIPSGILWKNENNDTIQVISSSTMDRELYVEEDIQVNDDLEIYFINGLNQLTEIEQADKSLNTISGTYKSIFQGFGNYIQNPEQPILSYLAINNTDEKQQISGYTIPSSCPFNYAHTIPAGTKLVGLNWETKEINDYLPSGYIAIFRVRSWWSDIVKCSGKILAKPINLNIDNILNVVSNYDYVERNYGFFKYQQENMHKSNVYSVKLTNSGLNPENDEDVTLIFIDTKKKLIDKITSEYVLTTDKRIILKDDTSNELVFALYYNDKNNYFYAQLPDQHSQLNSKLPGELPLKLLNNYIISFDDLIQEINWKIVYDTNNKYKYAYNITEYNQIINRNKVKNEMRELLETAIKKSVSKYMPVETTLWKIIYNGK